MKALDITIKGHGHHLKILLHYFHFILVNTIEEIYSAWNFFISPLYLKRGLTEYYLGQRDPYSMCLGLNSIQILIYFIHKM
jgi:hypothetical protein